LGPLFHSILAHKHFPLRSALTGVKSVLFSPAFRAVCTGIPQFSLNFLDIIVKISTNPESVIAAKWCQISETAAANKTENKSIPTLSTPRSMRISPIARKTPAEPAVLAAPAAG